MNHDNVWTPEKISQSLTEKQKRLSIVYEEITNFELEFDFAKKKFETKEAELSLLYETDTLGDRLSDKKIHHKVLKNQEYQELWSEHIVAKSKLRKKKAEKEIIIKELKTLENIAMVVAVDMKYLNR